MAQRAVAKAAEDGGKDAEIRRRFIDLQAAGCVDINVAIRHGKTEPLFHHGNQHGDAIEVDTGRRPPRGSVLGGYYQGLDLDEDRPGSFHSTDDRAPRQRTNRVRSEKGRRIPHRTQSAAVISNTPTSLAAPNRFFTARTIR